MSPTQRSAEQLIHNQRKLFQIEIKIKILKWQHLQSVKGNLHGFTYVKS